MVHNGTRAVRDSPVRLTEFLGSPGPAYRARGPAGDGLRYAAPLLDRLVVGSLPRFRNGGEPALFTDGLEAEPSVSELGGHGRAMMCGGWSLAFPAIEAAPPLGRIASLIFVHPPLEETTFRRRRLYLPHIPDLSQPVLECPVRHPGLRACRFCYFRSEFLATPLSGFHRRARVSSRASTPEDRRPRWSLTRAGPLDRQRDLIEIGRRKRERRGADPPVDL